MERRKFLASSSAIGLATTVTAGPIVSSLFSNFNSRVLLQDFGVESKQVFDNFKAELILNFEAIGQNKKMINRIVMPVEIISNKIDKSNESITYKNKAGDFVVLTKQKGIEKIKILKFLV